MLLAVCGLLILPVTLWAQAATGSIAGVVRDTSGAFLPGVTIEAVSPALIEKTRTVVTDGAGAYRIVELRPGTYSVTFSLPGFSSVRREGIELSSSFTATVNAELMVGNVAEAMTGGVQLNIIPKDGGNNWSGSFASSFTGPSLHAKNLDDDLRARGLQTGASIKVFKDNGGAFGGPIARNRLWFYTAHRYWGSQKYIQGTYYNKSPDKLFYCSAESITCGRSRPTTAAALRSTTVSMQH
jgi:hypothetical protein